MEDSMRIHPRRLRSLTSRGAAILCASLIVALCGGGTATGEPPATIPGPAASAAAAVSAAATAYTEPVRLTFPNFQAQEKPYSTWWGEFIAAYQAKYPNVTIQQSTAANSGALMQTMLTQFAAGSPPDIIQQATGNFYQLADAGYLMPLDELVAGTNVPSNWGPLQGQFVWKGKTMGVMTLSSALTLFYNKEVLASASVQVPRTADALIAAAKAIHAPGKGIYGFAGTTAGIDTTIQNESGAFVFGTGGSWFKSCQPNFTDATVQRAVKAYADTLAFSPKGYTQAQRNTLFESGKAGFMIDKASYIARLSPDKFGAAPLPFDRVAGNPNVFLAMPASLTGAKRWAAENFIKLAVSAEWQTRYAQLIGAPAPDSKATAELAKSDPQMKLFAEQMTKVVDILPAGCPDVQVNYPLVQRTIYDALIKIVSTGAAIDTTMQELQQTVAGQIKRK
jgi:multiple sugar transport system substrate-binding protein